jgi:DNA-binding NarL/FixJ family response regulator
LRADPDWEICGKAADGLTAVEYFRDLHPQVVILEFKMPGINGLEAASRMMEIATAVPIVMFTQDASASLEEPAQKVGIQSVVLIVDDHEMMRRGIRSVLESRDDVEAYEAENGKEAFDKTHEIQPHLVILDVSMPVLDGFSAAREIKKVFPQIPIMIFSLDRTETFAEVAKKIDVSAYVSKAMSARHS